MPAFRPGTGGSTSLVATHPHDDHVGGFALLLRRYHVGRVATSRMAGRGPAEVAFEAALASRGPQAVHLVAGEQFVLDGVAFKVLWPDAGSVPSGRAGRRIGHQRRFDRAARGDRSPALPADGRHGAGHRSDSRRPGPAPGRPAQGRPSRQPDGDERHVPRRGRAPRRSDLRRGEERLRAPRARDGRAAGRAPGRHLPHGPERDGRRDPRWARDGGEGRTRRGLGVRVVFGVRVACAAGRDGRACRHGCPARPDARPVRARPVAPVSSGR